MLPRDAHTVLLAVLIVCLTTMSACSGRGGDHAAMSPEGQPPSLTAEGPAAGMPGLPADDYVAPNVIVARRGSELEEQAIAAADAFAASANTEVDGGRLRFTPAGSSSGAWAVYAFTDLLSSDLLLRLAIDHAGAEDLPDTYCVGISDYTHNRWRWVEVAVPTSSDNVPVPDEFNAISPGGVLYAAIVELGETAGLLDTVTLHFDSHYLPAPEDFAAGEGAATDTISLSWTDPGETWPGLEYDAVEVERALDPAGPWETVAAVSAPQAVYDDVLGAGGEVLPVQPVYYRLRTALAEIKGPAGLAAAGWLAVPDVELIVASDGLPERIEVTWPAVPFATGYELEYRSLHTSYEPAEWAPLVQTGSWTETVFIHTPSNPPGLGCEWNVTYAYRVRAVIGEIASLDGPVDTGACTWPNEFEATDGEYPNRVMLSWRGWTNVDSYVVHYRNTEGGAPAQWEHLVDLPQQSHTEFNHDESQPVGLEADYGTIYAYRLYGVINGEFSDIVLEEDTGYRVIGVVQNLAATQNDVGKITLSWDDVPQAQGYRIEYRNLDGGSPADWEALADTGMVETFDHTETEPAGKGSELNVVYEYRIQALWREETSLDWSNEASGIRTFGDVTGFDATNGYYVGRTVLKWDATPLADSYEIEYRNLVGGTPADWSALAVVSGGTVTSFDHTETEPPGKGCVLFDKYDYRIRAARGAERSPGWAMDDGYAGTGPGDWNMDGREPMHQRRSPYIGPDTPDVKWSVELGTSWDTLGSPAIASDGTIYTADYRGVIHAVNPDGTEKWRYEGLRHPFCETPLIDDDGTIYLVVIGTTELGGWSYLQAVNPDGTLKWLSCGGGTGSYTVMASPNMLSDGTLIWSNSVDYDLVNGRLLATNPDSSYRWAYNDFFVARFAPAVSATDTIYATIADCEHWQREARCAQTFRLHAINPDGSTQWYTDQLGNARSPSVADDGRIYTPSLGGLYCHNSDGTQAWHLAMGISYGHAVAIGADGCVYSGLHTDYDNELCYLYAINLDGTVRWTYEIPYGTGISYSAPAIDGAGTIYMGHADGLHAINPDGSLKWVFERGYHEYGAPYSPAIGEDGTVYIGFGGTLYAIGPGAS